LKPLKSDFDALFCLLPKLLAVGTRPYQEEAAIAIEVSCTNSDYRFHDHVAQKMQPKATQMFRRKRANADIARKGSLDEARIVETGQKREVIHRVSADRIVEVNEGGDLIAGPKNVPKREVFVDKTAQRQIEQCPMVFNLGSDFVALFPTKKASRNEEGEVLVESKVEVIVVATASA